MQAQLPGLHSPQPLTSVSTVSATMASRLLLLAYARAVSAMGLDGRAIVLLSVALAKPRKPGNLPQAQLQLPYRCAQLPAWCYLDRPQTNTSGPLSTFCKFTGQAGTCAPLSNLCSPDSSASSTLSSKGSGLVCTMAALMDWLILIVSLSRLRWVTSCFVCHPAPVSGSASAC